MDVVSRPGPKKQKINTKDEFELCYLRHQYIRKSPKNPTDEEIQPYMGIVTNQARKTLITNYYLFAAVGLALDDIINIGRVHTVSFLNLFSMENMPEKMAKFVDAHVKKKGREPDYVDLADKNKANFTLFMKQRFEDLVRICRQKSRNIEGIPSEDFVAFVGQNPPRYLKALLKDYSNLGFRKLDPAVFRTIKKRARPDNQDFFQYNNEWYVVVRMERFKLTIDNLIASDLNPFNSEHNFDPEENLSGRIEEERFLEARNQYDSLDEDDKARIIRDFIRKKGSDNRYMDELRTARRILKSME